MSISSYQDLNLNESASITEIKAAFRSLAKAHHPDAEGRTPEDVEKFIRAQTAYQRLMKKAVTHNRLHRAAETAQASEEKPAAAKPAAEAPRQARAAANWRFEGRREIGLDVYYRLFILRPGPEGGRVTLPWQAREACPRCLGQGQTLAKIGQNSLYRPCACSKCGGQGSLSRDSRLEVSLTPEMIGRDKIRLRRCGLYNSKTAQRGDLILEVTWVDHLPADN
jgi:DnaJ-class molecular chaperone with C-terminal Zn finger domain